MAYVKYKDLRINLDNIILYRPIDSNKKPTILFLTSVGVKGENTVLPLHNWTFETKKERDLVLEKIDAIVSSKEIKINKGSISGDVNAQLIG